MKKEQWLNVPGFEGKFQVSSLGRVKSLGREILIRGKHKGLIKTRILAQTKRGKGYNCVVMDNKAYSTHRIVLCAFDSKPLNYPLHVNHKNEIKTDNRPENLEWCTNKQNSNYGTKPDIISAKLTKRQVRQIDEFGINVKIWKNTMEPFKGGFNPSHVASCCRGKRKTHGGYRWEFENIIMPS